MLASQLPRLRVEPPHGQVAHAHEHLLEAGAGRIPKGHPGFGGNRLRQVALAGPGRANEHETLGDLAPHALELFHAPQQRDDPLRHLQDVLLAAIVLEGNAGLTWQDPVGATPREEVEERAKLHDHEQNGEGELEEDREDQNDIREQRLDVRQEPEQKRSGDEQPDEQPPPAPRDEARDFLQHKPSLPFPPGRTADSQR